MMVKASALGLSNIAEELRRYRDLTQRRKKQPKARLANAKKQP